VVKGSIKIIGDKQLAAKFKRVAKAVPKQAADAGNKALIVVDREVKKNITNNILKVGQTGTLRRSWVINRLTPQKLFGKIGIRLVYAAIHEFGGVIKAKRAKYLRFKTRDGSWHSVKQVRIPARKYFSKAIKQAKPEIIRVFDKATARMVKA